MSTPPRVLAIVQAGGQGSRMDVLTRERAKPALAFGGSYQLIDFAMSSLSHSQISDVWVSVQYLADTLDPHLAGGRPWDLDRTRGGYRRLVPQEGDSQAESGFSRGNADNLARVQDTIAEFGPDLVVVMSADHVFALDLRDVIESHMARKASCTIVTAEVTRTEAASKAVVTLDAKSKVTDFAYKPTKPQGTTVATEIFVYDAATLLSMLDDLRRELGHDEDDGNALGDFGDHLLPNLVKRGKVFAYPMDGYWRDLGQPYLYYAAHRDLLAGKLDAVGRPDWPILSRFPERPPAHVHDGASVSGSIINPGCQIRGSVSDSVLGPGVVVEPGAQVSGCILGADVIVRAGADVRLAIVDEATDIGRRAVVGGATKALQIRDNHLTLIGRDSMISPATTIEAGARLEPGSSV